MNAVTSPPSQSIPPPSRSTPTPSRSTPTPTPPPRHVRKDVARNRELLLAAADVVFRERGAQATLDDVARQAGVGVATAYRHFESKQALIEALIDDRLQRAEEIIEEAEALEDPRRGLEHFLYGVCALQAKDRGMREAMASEQPVDKADHLRERFVPRVVQLVDAAQRAGVLRPEFSATDVAPMIWMIGALNDHAGAISPELWRRYLAFLIDGVLAEGEARATELVGSLSIEEATSVATPELAPSRVARRS